MRIENCPAITTYSAQASLTKPLAIKRLAQVKRVCAFSILSLALFVPQSYAAPLSYDETIDGDIVGDNNGPLTVFNLDVGTNLIKGSKAIGDSLRDGDDFKFTVGQNAVVTSIKLHYSNVVTDSISYLKDARYLTIPGCSSSWVREETTIYHYIASEIETSPNEVFSATLPLGAGTYGFTDGDGIGVGSSEVWSASWDYTYEITVVDQTADYVVTTETALTDNTQSALTPVLGHDGTSKIVVYSVSSSSGTDFNNIYYQRLNTDGSLSGTPVQVSISTSHDLLHDTYGKYIVYTARETDQTSAGSIVVFNIETGISTVLISSATKIGAAKINGDHIVWTQSSGSNAFIFYYNTAWLGTNTEPTVIAGPDPTPRDLQIGDRFVTWSQFATNEDGVNYGQIMAYDIANDTYYMVENDGTFSNRQPTTAGDWVFYERQAHDGSTRDVKGVNIDSGETRILGKHSYFSFQPSFDGEYVGYDVFAGDSTEAFVYRLADGQHFQITSQAGNQWLNNVYGNDIAYIDRANGESIAKVSHFDIMPGNKPPVANAGVDQSVHPSSLVTLDGSASSDPDGNYALSYLWTITSKPAGSTAVLVNANSVNPTFNADLLGDYTFSLKVIDSLGSPSTTDCVIVSTLNTAPIADAGSDQAITTIDTVVTLDGSQSYDLEGDSLTYAWSLTGKPVDSAAILSDANSAMPVFVADTQGTYMAQLIVSDAWASSEPATVTISFANITPVANAGGNQSVSVGDAVYVDGNASTDTNGDSLTYQWGFASTPSGSLATISDATNVSANFVADVAGTYVLSLVVNDGMEDSTPHNINVIATTQQAEIVGSVNNIIAIINGLDPAVFKNSKNMANTLTNKLIAVLDLIDQGLYQDALDKLKKDVLKKTNGCATTGKRDKNDWIKSCAEQTLVYDAVMETIVLLEELV